MEDDDEDGITGIEEGEERLTIVSSDGHEFELPKHAALMSSLVSSIVEGGACTLRNVFFVAFYMIFVGGRQILIVGSVRGCF